MSAVIMIFAWSSLHAQPARSDAARALSLSRVLSSVRAHHPALAAELANVRASEGESLSARGEFDPQLSLRARAAPAGYYDPKRFDVVVEQATPVWGISLYTGYRIGQGTIAPYYGEQRTLSRGEVRSGVRVPILQDGRIDARRAGIRAADLQLQASEHDYDAVLLELERQAAAAYFGWLVAGRRLSVADDLLALAEQRDAQIAQKVELGALPRIEALDNRRTILERRRQRVQAERAFEKAAIDLSLFLRDGDGQPLIPDRTQLPAQSAAESRDLPTIEAAAAHALSQRPELSSVEAQLDVARVEQELARNQVLPRLDLFGEISKDFGRGAEPLSSTLQPTAVEVGTALSVPLGLRKARGKLRAATAKAVAAEQKVRYARDKVRAEVLDAWSQLRAARERASVAREAAATAVQVASGERERFELGASTVLFVNLREQAAADAEVARLEAEVDAELAALRALLVMGHPLLVESSSQNRAVASSSGK